MCGVPKYRKPVLVSDKRALITQYIQQSALEKKIWIDCINGYTEHLHALIPIGARGAIGVPETKAPGQIRIQRVRHGGNQPVGVSGDQKRVQHGYARGDRIVLASPGLHLVDDGDRLEEGPTAVPIAVVV